LLQGSKLHAIKYFADFIVKLPVGWSAVPASSAPHAQISGSGPRGGGGRQSSKMRWGAENWRASDGLPPDAPSFVPVGL